MEIVRKGYIQLLVTKINHRYIMLRFTYVCIYIYLESASYYNLVRVIK